MMYAFASKILEKYQNIWQNVTEVNKETHLLWVIGIRIGNTLNYVDSINVPQVLRRPEGRFYKE